MCIGENLIDLDQEQSGAFQQVDRRREVDGNREMATRIDACTGCDVRLLIPQDVGREGCLLSPCDLPLVRDFGVTTT